MKFSPRAWEAAIDSECSCFFFLHYTLEQVRETIWSRLRWGTTLFRLGSLGQIAGHFCGESVRRLRRREPRIDRN